MKINKKQNQSLETEGLNQAIENTNKSKSSKRISKISTVIMSAIIGLTLTACGTSIKGTTPNEVAGSIDVVSEDIDLEMTDAKLMATLGSVESNIKPSFWPWDTESMAEMTIETPSGNVDFLYQNTDNSSIAEIIQDFKTFLSKEEKDNSFTEVTNGKIIQESSESLESDGNSYCIFENANLLRYNQTDKTLAIFDLSNTISFSDIEKSESKYVSLPETREADKNVLEYSSLKVPKTYVKK